MTVSHPGRHRKTGRHRAQTPALWRRALAALTLTFTPGVIA